MMSNKFSLSILKIIAAVLLFTVPFTLQGCKKDGTGISNEKPELSFGIMPDVDSIPILIAKQQGYFEDEGLNIDIETFRSAMDRDSALQSGNIDGCISDALAAVFAASGGFDVKITSLTNGSYKLLAGKNKGINGINDIKGKSVGLSRNTIIEYMTDMMALKEGIDPEEIEKTAIKDMPVRLEMLQNGNIDLATLPEPLASVAAANGAMIIGSSEQLGINPGIILFTFSAIDEKEDSIRAFYRAYNKAVDYLVKARLEDYADMLISEAGFPEAIRENLMLPAYTKADMISENEYIKAAEWIADRRLISGSPAKFNDITDDRFLK